MSDSYTIEGVTVTPQGGGFYALSHPSLPEPVKERGKENADNRAKVIAESLRADEDDGSMPPQGELVAPPEASSQDSAKDDEIAALKAQLAKTQEIISSFKGETKTVTTDGGDVPEPSGKIPGAVPRKYDGVLDDKAKAEMKRLGVETTDIVLEENETIPPTGLFLGHNGRGYVIVPGEQVTVPNFLLGVLDDAVMAAPVVDNKSGKVLGWRTRMRYPYRRL